MLGTLGAPASHFTLQDPGLSPLQLETDRAMGFPLPLAQLPFPHPSSPACGASVSPWSEGASVSGA